MIIRYIFSVHLSPIIAPVHVRLTQSQQYVYIGMIKRIYHENY